jgi:hypothetical protein
VTQHDLKQLFSNVIRDMSGGSGAADPDVTNLTGGGIATPSTGVPTLAAAMEKASKTAIKRVTTIVGAAAGIDDATASADDDRDSAVGAPAKELSYRQFLELLAAVSHYVIRNPYYALHDRVEKFIISVLASRKKLPAKIYRSAV